MNLYLWFTGGLLLGLWLGDVASRWAFWRLVTALDVQIASTEPPTTAEILNVRPETCGRVMPS